MFSVFYICLHKIYFIRISIIIAPDLFMRIKKLFCTIVNVNTQMAKLPYSTTLGYYLNVKQNSEKDKSVHAESSLQNRKKMFLINRYGAIVFLEFQFIRYLKTIFLIFERDHVCRVRQLLEYVFDGKSFGGYYNIVPLYPQRNYYL